MTVIMLSEAVVCVLLSFAILAQMMPRPALKRRAVLARKSRRPEE